MKKTLVLAAVTALALGVLAACGGSKKADGSGDKGREQRKDDLPHRG